jgi:uncharacterized protein (DUF736 family)
MAIIGTFTATSDGGWEGRIRTLTINVRARIVPNDNRDSDKAPDYLVLVGPTELGAAWVRRSREYPTREYLLVQLDDPSLAQPIAATLLFQSGNDCVRMVWSRRS